MTLPEAAEIEQALSAKWREFMDGLDLFAEIGSTNSYLLDASPPAPGRFRVALADFQSAGRGRMERRWQAPPGTGLCLSIAYSFEEMPQQVSALTLAVGQALIDGVVQLGYSGITLKWPNDLMANDAKLGGILTELRTTGGATVVVGLGLNVDFAATGNALPGNAIDLYSLDARPIDKTMLIATVIESLADCIAAFERSGFGAWFERWSEFDWLKDRAVHVDTGESEFDGVAAGIDRDGALLVAVGDRAQRVISGSVTSVTGPNS